MRGVRNFKGVFENAPCEIGCSSKATAGSIGFAVNTGRSMLSVLVNFILFFFFNTVGRTRAVNDTDV